MDLNYMLGILHILILVVSSWAHTTTPDDALIIEYDKPDFQASHYQAIYNKTRNEYVTNKQRMFDVAQDFKEAKAAYTAAVNAQLGQAVDNDGNVIIDKCSWFSYVARDASCSSGGMSSTAAAATAAGGSVAAFALINKLLPCITGCCGGAAAGAVASKGGSGPGPGYGPGYGYGYGYGGRGYRDYSQTMGSHTIEAPILPVADITKTPIKKKKKKRKQIWLVCMVLLVIIIIGVICFALLQDNE